MSRLARWLLALALVATGLAVATPAAAASPQGTDKAAVVWYVTVHNLNIERWLRVMNGNGAYHDIPPTGKKAVAGGVEPRSIWVKANCSYEKDGNHWASAGAIGFWKDFGYQPTEVDIYQYC